MKKSIFISTLSLSILTLNSIAASPAENAVEYRQAVMTLIKANFAEMGAMIKGKKPFDEKKFNTNAKNLKALSSMPWAYFAVEDSDIVESSKAKDSVWEDSKKFSKASKYFRKVVNKLDKVAKPKNSDKNAVKMAFLDVAKTCKGCHKNFKNK